MKVYKLTILVLLLLLGCVACQKKNPVVEFQTPKGKILVELDIENAPITASHFLKLVKEGYYDGASFYRSVRGATKDNPVHITVVQGGVSGMGNKRRVESISHESTDITGLTHSNGVISMARNKPGSASTEFFFCMGENQELDFGGKRNPDGQGFAAFGKAIEGFKTLHDLWGASAMGEQIDPKIIIYKIKVQ
ncbi:MAG: peptidylprolyl isomerase [Bacteroidota bacterium]|nr:peptidylprolyl isomerase [Bacteroidota bacterium]